VDETGAKDAVEFINVSRDDALAYPKHVHRTYPSTVNERMESTIVPFVKKSSEINDLMMEVLGDRLGLPKGTLSKKHQWEEKSGSETRCIKKMPTTEVMTEAKAAIGAHTDFGSMVSDASPACGPVDRDFLVFFAQPTWRLASTGPRNRRLAIHQGRHSG
jgi:hypothetical protein